MEEIAALDERCITHIVSLTSPRDACRASSVSKYFKSLSDSNLVWEKFLPVGCKEMISPSVLNKLSSKDLYLSLWNTHVILNGGNKSLSLDRESGKKCFMVGAKEMAIASSNDPQCWKWVSRYDSRFEEIAELINVQSLHMQCTFDTRMLSEKTDYVAYLVTKLTDEAYGLYHPPALSTIRFVEHGYIASDTIIYLAVENELLPSFFPIYEPSSSSLMGFLAGFPNKREDGWMEVEIGRFYNDEGESGDVEITVAAINSLQWKSGLIVQGIELRPDIITT